MSVEQRLAYVEALKKHPDESRNLLLTVFATEDEFGNPLFLPDDIAPLRKKNAGVIARIAETIDSMIPTREEILKNLPAPR
jgi:vesicle coat complex subunit